MKTNRRKKHSNENADELARGLLDVFQQCSLSGQLALISSMNALAPEAVDRHPILKQLRSVLPIAVLRLRLVPSK